MNKLISDLYIDWAVYFGASLAVLGFAGIFIGTRSFWVVLSISVFGILMFALGVYLRRKHQVQPTSRRISTGNVLRRVTFPL